MSVPAGVTLVTQAIHNPNEPRHFMRVVPTNNERHASVASTSIARSADALIVKEVGHDIYDHVTYFPRADVDMAVLVKVDKSTHCPLKGNTEYFDIVVGDQRITDAAWSYVDTIDEATELHNLIAFDTSKVDVS